MEQETELKYPKCVFLIIANEFCERFSFYGLRAVLAVYMVSVLGFTEHTSTTVYHAFVMLCYFFPVLGAMLADGLLGKFKTTIYLSIVYALGTLTLTLASADGAIGIPALEISMLGLFLIAFGTGGIKPCVAALGGDQFILPQQEAQLEHYFSIFYISINAGSLLSMLITPVLKKDVQCAGADSCYPLAFGVPAVLMITAIVFILLGAHVFVKHMPSEVIFVKIFRIICNAISVKRKSTEKKEHWLDHAEEKFGKKSVTEVKLLLKVLVLFIPLPIFWALFDQQGSRWTFQAVRMDGRTGNWTLYAEQLQFLNPLLILILVPTFDYGIYPLLAKCKVLTKLLTRLTVGGVLAGLSFIISAVLEIWLEPTYAVLPMAGNAQLRFFNTFDCDVKLTADIPGGDDHIIKALGLWEVKDIPAKSEDEKELTVTMDDASCGSVSEYKGSVTFSEKTASSHLITKMDGAIVVKGNMDLDDVEKSSAAEPKLRIIYSFIDPQKSRNMVLSASGKEIKFNLKADQVGTDYQEIIMGKYTAKVDDMELDGFDLEMGGVYSLLITETTADKYKTSLHVITPPNAVHMLWQFPQYFVMTAGEAMFSVSGLQFSYTQAPDSMKTVIQAAWLLTVALGNLIVVIITEAKIFHRQMYEFLLFAGLMFVDMVIFAAIAWRYKYVDLKEGEEDN